MEQTTERTITLKITEDGEFLIKSDCETKLNSMYTLAQAFICLGKQCGMDAKLNEALFQDILQAECTTDAIDDIFKGKEG